ncbi:mechanosensitive ion channel family protein [Nitrosopumilus sp.]|uniref:mechanosensitive ion channel family protein n=1 Tax=Nitrosopumilus sp. TaxID=2024843 RepID=UPI003B5A6204
MAEDTITNISTGEFQTLSEIVFSSLSIQISLIVLVLGLISIILIHKKFARWVNSKEISHIHPELAEFARKVMLPVFAIVLITAINVHVQAFELFDEEVEILESEASDSLTHREVFAKLLSSLNIFSIGYAVSQLIPILITKYDRTKQERTDFDSWKMMTGFADDEQNFFHRIFEWVPPKHPPKTMSNETFQKLLETKDGRKSLEQHRTTRGFTIGSYKQLVDDPLKEWRKSETKKYLKYLKDCTSGNNFSGYKLRLGVTPQEVYPFDIWAEQKRLAGYAPVLPGEKPPGWAQKRVQDIPKSFRQWIPIFVNVAVFLGIVAWWQVDLVVLATATGGLSIGIGFALKETMENYFAYVFIRKDRMFLEGDRIEVDGYNGYVHKITPRVTYIRHALNESLAVIPTKQLVTSKIINYTTSFKLVPAEIDVGVSYLNDPEQVAAIMMKIGKRAMKEITDSEGAHMIIQEQCPYLLEGKKSCGCDKDVLVDMEQPKVRFRKFDDSALYFGMWVYVKDYGSQFKVESDMRMMMYKEFKKYDIRIPWPIRTIYQGDEKREYDEISKYDEERKRVLDEYGTGDPKKENKQNGEK